MIGLEIFILVGDGVDLPLAAGAHKESAIAAKRQGAGAFDPAGEEGNLESGGINGEGTHKLIRPGGDSQTVYLTSSVLDLNQFVGKKVKVWGQTFSAKKAGWLMDVGRVEVL